MTFIINIFGHEIACGTRAASDVFPDETGFLCYAGDWSCYGVGASELEALASFIADTAQMILNEEADQAYGDYEHCMEGQYNEEYDLDYEEWSHEDIRHEESMNDDIPF